MGSYVRGQAEPRTRLPRNGIQYRYNEKVHLAKSEDVADYDKMSEDIKNIYEA